jgi:hypothetical protein
MNSKEDYTEHTIHGHVPQDEWHKFFKRHFAPTKPGAQTQAAARAASGSASDICASLGCPTTFGGKNLHHCRVDVEADGSTTIHCVYQVMAVHP